MTSHCHGPGAAFAITAVEYFRTSVRGELIPVVLCQVKSSCLDSLACPRLLGETRSIRQQICLLQAVFHFELLYIRSQDK